MKTLEFIQAPGFDKLIRMSVLILCLLVLGIFGFYCLYSGKTLDGVGMVVGVLVTVVTNIVGFDWGSSAGSKGKDEMIGKLLHKDAQPVKENENA